MFRLRGFFSPNTHMQALVIPMGQRREVSRIHTSRIPACVMQFMPIGNGAVRALPHRHMSKDQATGATKPTVPIFVSKPSPVPAPGLGIDSIGIVHTERCVMAPDKPHGLALHDARFHDGELGDGGGLATSAHAQAGRIRCFDWSTEPLAPRQHQTATPASTGSGSRTNSVDATNRAIRGILGMHFWSLHIGSGVPCRGLYQQRLGFSRASIIAENRMVMGFYSREG